MALITCPDCGQQMSDSAPECRNCGYRPTTSIVIARPSLMGAMVGMEVWVDGKPFGNLKARGQVAVPIPPGSHAVEVRTSQGRSGSTTVSVSPGSQTTLSVAVGKLMGNPKFS